MQLAPSSHLDLGSDVLSAERPLPPPALGQADAARGSERRAAALWVPAQEDGPGGWWASTEAASVKRGPGTRVEGWEATWPPAQEVQVRDSKRVYEDTKKVQAKQNKNTKDANYKNFI